MSNYTRNCPECQKVIFYCGRFPMLYAERDRKLCKKCASLKRAATPEFLSRAKHAWDKINKEVELGLRKNGFAGHKHTDEYKKRASESRRGTPLKDDHKEKVIAGVEKARQVQREANYPSVYEWWLKKYGKEEADKRMAATKEKWRKNATGSNNNMYGKPSPQGSGNGWSGWYKGFYFRSLRELMFLYYADRFKLRFRSLEKKSDAIEYTDFTGKKRNYFGDYLVNDKYFIEIKPTRLQTSQQNLAKKEAALQICAKNKWIYKQIDPPINTQIIKRLWESKKIKMLPRYQTKMENFYCAGRVV